MMFNESNSGECTPVSGRYRELNVVGSSTGKAVPVTQGDALPTAPRGFTWRLLSDRSPAELRAQATAYRRMAEGARTIDVMARLRRIADRLNAMAERQQPHGNQRIRS